jgi:hypothetical protein
VALVGCQLIPPGRLGVIVGSELAAFPVRLGKSELDVGILQRLVRENRDIGPLDSGRPLDGILAQGGQRRSSEYGRAIHAGLLPSQHLESHPKRLGNPLSIRSKRIML